MLCLLSPLYSPKVLILAGTVKLTDTQKYPPFGLVDEHRYVGNSMPNFGPNSSHQVADSRWSKYNQHAKQGMKYWYQEKFPTSGVNWLSSCLGSIVATLIHCGGHFGSIVVATLAPLWWPLWLHCGGHFGSIVVATLAPLWWPLWLHCGGHFGSIVVATLAPLWSPLWLHCGGHFA